MQALPEQDWFCCQSCIQIHDTLMAAVEEGEACTGGDTFIVMRGRACTRRTAPILKRIEQILQECFDPIKCRSSGIDLLAHLVRGKSVDDWDFCGFYCLAMRGEGGHWVSALVFRVFGEELAEVPLVATVPSARGKGHGQKIMKHLQSLLESAGVQKLVLPSAKSTVRVFFFVQKRVLPTARPVHRGISSATKDGERVTAASLVTVKQIYVKCFLFIFDSSV